MNVLCLIVPLFALICFSGCVTNDERSDEQDLFNSGTVSQQLAEEGAEIFRDRAFGDVPIACVDCHNDFPDSLQRDRIMPGHSIIGVTARRETWYGEFTPEKYKIVAAGAAKCAFIYQLRGNSPSEALTSHEAASLMAFYSFISTGHESPNTQWETLSYPGDPDYKRDSIVAIVDSLNQIRGDAEKGAVLFDQACHYCHSDGEGRIGPAPRSLRRYQNRLFLYVRAGKSNMPFFSYDKLSDQDVADIREWTRQGAR